jgi:16S rRNA (guanine527-N7)-methyltransferase
VSVVLSPEAASQLERYLGELRAAGERINLVGSTAPADLARHVADSIEPAAWIPTGSRVVDLGSGAGFPGVPLAIARPDVAVTLVEIRERRVHFLRHVVRTLGLSCHVMRKEIETEAPPEGFDFALARALASPETALSLALPWVRSTGEVWIWASVPSRAVPAAIPEIPLSSGGCVLRVRVAAVPRGTRETT